MKEEFDFESIKNKAIEQLKQVQTPLGEVTVSTPRDRNSSFDPQFIKKRETIPLLQEKKYTIQATYTTGIKENHTGQKCKNRYRQKPK